MSGGWKWGFTPVSLQANLVLPKQRGVKNE